MQRSSLPCNFAFAALAGLAFGACASTADKAADHGSEVLRAEAPRLSADVYWLADDARYGRRSGTPGEDAARDYIAARLQELGIEAAGEGGYGQAFEVPMPARDGGGSSLRFTAGDTTRGVTASGESIESTATVHVSGESIEPLFCSEGGSVTGDLVFASFGIVDPEFGRDDFEGLDVAGKIVLIARGTPALPQMPEPEEAPAESGGYSHGPRTSWGNAASIFTKVMNAKHRGAIGVIIGQDPERAAEGLIEFDPGHDAQASLPVVMVDVKLANALVGGGSKDKQEGYSLRIANERRPMGDQATPPAMKLARAVTVNADVIREPGTADNVLGVLRGEDSSRYLVVGAHYDHLGFGGTGSLDPDATEIHNGADDNASGTAAVLELARLLAAGPKPACDIVFALWSGEELGLLGSEHWNKNTTHDGQLIANLNMDRVGRAKSGRLQVMGAGTSDAFLPWLPEAASRADLDPTVTLSGHGIGGSDHQSFIKRGIPALHLFTGVHGDYHKPSDDAGKFEADGTRRIVEYARFLVNQMAAAESLPFNKVELAEEDDRPQRERSWSVWFGSIPDYAGEGGGLLLSGVQENSPAARAGLLGGDVILQLGDIEVDTIHDFVHALQVYQPGNVLACRVNRRGVEQTVTVTLGTRAVE